MPRHSREFIHQRHLQRLRRLEALRTYRRAYRAWLAAVHRRAQLLARLSAVEQRLQRHEAGVARRHLTEIVFELNGAWQTEQVRRASRQPRQTLSLRGPVALPSRYFRLPPDRP